MKNEFVSSNAEQLQSKYNIFTTLVSLLIQTLNAIMYCSCIIARSLVATTVQLVRKIQYLYFIFSPAWLW